MKLLKIEVLLGEPETLEADGLLEFLFEDEPDLTGVLAEIDTRLEGLLQEILSTEEAKGRLHEVTVIHSTGKLPARRLLLIGAGKHKDLSIERLSHLFGQAVRQANNKGWRHLVIGTTALELKPFSPSEVVRWGVVGALEGLAKTDFYKTTPERQELKLQRLTFASPQGIQTLEQSVREGRAIGEGVNLARELVNQPPNRMTPRILAEHALALAEEASLEVEVLGPSQLERMGAYALLAVSRGSREEPRMFRLSYGHFSEKPTLALVGKGLTFDSGGLCLKSADNMRDMKCDMAGAAAVLGAMKALSLLQLPINVIAICPSCENMPGAEAYKPGDVLNTLFGKTIEVVNTDAEGRIILVDALAWAQNLGATHIVDIATLTGACVVALGDVTTGVLGTPQEWVDRVITCAREAGEKVWQLPLYEEYKELIKSPIADVENSGGRLAGAITAALFLKEFVKEEIPWAHLDIAGTAYVEKDFPYRDKGATGVGVKTLVRLAERMSQEL